MKRHKLEDLFAAMGVPEAEQAAAPQGEGFKVAETIRSGDRHEMLYKLLRSQKARGISLEGALATCHAENKGKCNPPIEHAELERYLKRVWEQPDSPTFAQNTSARDFPLTDRGNAECFVAAYSDRVRYDHRRKRFLVLHEETGIWRPDTVESVRGLATSVIRDRQRRAVDIADGEKKKLAQRWTIASESTKGISNLLREARSIPPVRDDGEGWDECPFLLGTPTGVVDLTTGELRKGLPEERITMMTSVPYDPDATCPLWEATVAEVFGHDRELLNYIQRAFGYSITGDCREECFFVAYGDGCNGKGTTINTVARILSTYADDVPFSTLERRERSNIPADLAKLVGKRFVTASESSETLQLNEARIKGLTGRDPITARHLYQDYFTFQPVAKFWLSTNQKPVVRDDSDGFWRRVHLIPFTQSFIGKANLRLKDQLLEEAPGILAWLVRGAIAWQREGLKRPDAVNAATNAYRHESEPLSPFIEARCIELPHVRVQASALFAEYQKWCDELSIPKWERMSLTAFGTLIKKRFKAEAGRQVYYVGLALRSDMPLPFDTPDTTEDS